MKAFFFDLETTGLDHWRHGIHQISGCIEIDGVAEQGFNYKVRPHGKAKIEEAALAVSGVTKEQIEKYTGMIQVYEALVDMLGDYVDKFSKTDKFHTIGYNNASFDNQFLREFFKQNGDKYFGSWFWSAPIDVMVLAAEHLKEDRPLMKDFKLATVARQFGVDVKDASLHDAAYDIYLTREIYNKIIKS